MFKRIAVLLIFALVASILSSVCIRNDMLTAVADEVEFERLNDPNLPGYIEDSIYASLVNELDSDQYYVENVSTVYISKEYIRNLEYNSKSNVFFGYTLAELDAQFEGQKYVFTLGENGETIVAPFIQSDNADSSLKTILKNVAIGTGVILVCVTVALITKNPASAAGAGKAVRVIFAVSSKAAKHGAITAIKLAGVDGISTAIIAGYKTKDFQQAIEAGAIAASEGFKFGAITGTAKSIASDLIYLGNTVYFRAGTRQAMKYPEGVRFTEMPNGDKFPRFEKYAKATAKFDTPTIETALNHTGLSGNYYWDSKLANQMCGFSSTPQGYVWHHVEDMKTMILVPQDLHSIAMGGMPHTGGASMIRAFLGV